MVKVPRSSVATTVFGIFGSTSANVHASVANNWISICWVESEYYTPSNRLILINASNSTKV